jgi:hypothetical protein
MFFSLPPIAFTLSGIKEASSSGKIHSEILLQASSVPADICISMLSDSDFTEVTKLFGRFLILNDEAKTF